MNTALTSSPRFAQAERHRPAARSRPRRARSRRRTTRHTARRGRVRGRAPTRLRRRFSARALACSVIAIPWVPPAPPPGAEIIGARSLGSHPRPGLSADTYCGSDGPGRPFSVLTAHQNGRSGRRSGVRRSAAMSDFDLVVRGATVVDGTGAPAREADVAVRAGRIVTVGDDAGPAAATKSSTGAASCSHPDSSTPTRTSTRTCSGIPTSRRRRASASRPSSPATAATASLRSATSASATTSSRR